MKREHSGQDRLDMTELGCGLPDRVLVVVSIAGQKDAASLGRSVEAVDLDEG